ncbi:MAG: hypothetical protein ACK6DN_04850, partial [Planctomycetota bacterium]
SLTRDWTPRVTAAGELDYEATDAAFTQQFWGEYEESDTRSVWDGHQWRLPERTLTRGGAYGAGASNPLVQTKAGGAALDLGFYNGGHHSWGYEGRPVHAHFAPATLGPGPGEDLAFWDDSANPDMAAGPSLFRQDGGGGLETGLGSGSDADQILTAWARVPPEVEANPEKYYSRVEYDNWGHYASFYGTAGFSVWSAVCPPLAFLTGMKTEAGGAFWSGLFRTSDDVSSEFYAVSNGITRVSGAALMVLACPASASTIYRLGLSFWASDQTLTGIDSMATGQDRQTLGGRALSPVLGKWFGNFVYDLGPPGPSAVNGLRNVAGWVKNLLRNPSKAADDVIDLADEVVAPVQGTSSLYDDVTAAGSRYANRATDVPKATFEKNLINDGWASSVSKDGKTIILEKDGARYVLRDGARSTGGPTADYYRSGSQGIDLKIRLGQGGTP